MKRIYHNYLKWEEHHAGMWGKVSKEIADTMLIKAIEFTGDDQLYGSFMMRVINEWPVSCEHNLTDRSMNRQAWIGHAACCLALGIPEHITRLAWHHLTQEQQDKANNQATKAILAWEQKCQKICLA